MDDITTDAFGATFYLMEIERITYAVTRYLRTRIFKIEQQSAYILDNDHIKDRLSLQERIFVDTMGGLNESHLKHTIGHNIINNDRLKIELMRNTEIIKNAIPELQDCVAVKAMEDINEIILGTLVRHICQI